MPAMKRAAVLLASIVALGACGGGSSSDFHEAALRKWAQERRSDTATDADVNAAIDGARDACGDVDVLRYAVLLDKSGSSVEMYHVACPKALAKAGIATP